MHSINHLGRRDFLRVSALLMATYGLPSHSAAASASGDFDPLVRGLLGDWCAGMLRHQIDQPGDPTRHGALNCPACGFIHGRCMDAVYPFLHTARRTGDERFLKAGINVFEWSRNVSLESGAWTVMPDPKSWTGITVFGAIALADALKWHGEILDAEVRKRWTARLRLAADFVLATFDFKFSNVNYGAAAVHGLHLFGKSLEDERYSKRAFELAREFEGFLTEPNRLVFGEGKPLRKSPRGLYPVDLGYNVEETLASLAVYAVDAGDSTLLELIERSMASHLEFMLPDGGWDNSWGTRQAKWSYWGSRTSDGCQAGFAVMASRLPACGVAAHRNTLLHKECTHGGLLHGGPHYSSHGMKPCIHHTFAHAKVLAAVIDRGLTGITVSGPLPREVADGVREFSELAVWLAARGPWRATVSAYDWQYRPGLHPATGGALAMLWNQRVGPVFASSMPTQMMVEPYNMQRNPGPRDFPLTPRVEAHENGTWFTNIYDLEAQVSPVERDGVIHFSVTTRLLDARQRPPASGPAEIKLDYLLSRDSVTVRAAVAGGGKDLKPSLVLPLVSASFEPITCKSSRRIEILKSGGLLVVESDRPLAIDEVPRSRDFNTVPGFEAVPIRSSIPQEAGAHVEVRIRID
jgi:hypothetical protein